jgi:hypothetical protein
MAMAIFNQFTGINAVNIYSTNLFEKMGISTTIGSIIVGVSQLFGVFIGAFVMRCGVGFRPLTIISALLLGTLLLLIGIFE